jgi:hypothetical protein
MSALERPVDRAVRLIDKTFETFRMPVIAPRLALVAVHALLHHGPFAVVGDEKTVQIKLKTVLHGGAVNFRDETAGAGQRRAVETDALAQRRQFRWRAARMFSPAAADMNASLQRRQPALQCADHGRCDAGRVPVHSHHRAERLEPERMRQPLQEFVAAVMVDDAGDDRAERGHPFAQPLRNPSAMERKIRAAGLSCHRAPDE